MRAKTVKRLAILIAVIGLVGGGGYLAWRSQVEKMGRGVLEQAARAEAAQDFLKAEELYRQRLAVMPNDPDTLAKYANVLVKVDKTPRRREEALGIYETILKRPTGREDVRRRAAELAIEARDFNKARLHLGILLRSAPDDGHLQYLMGQCLEEDKEAAAAAQSYAAAIAHQAPERLEAYQRHAALLRGSLNQKGEADQAIETMVQSDAKNYQVYLERGRYRNRFGLPGARDDFQQARQLAPQVPEIYLEMAQMEQAQSRADAARRALEDGLKVVPGSVPLTLALANLELRTGRLERGIAILRQGLEVNPNRPELRFPLALILAERGATAELLLQIEELKRIEFNPTLIQYFTAYYHINRNDYIKARQILLPLQTEVARSPELKGRVNLLLARCHDALKEPEQAQLAYERALVSNPQDLRAQLGLLDGMMARGEFDRAIEECRRLMDRAPELRITLAQLLITKNRNLPESRRTWGEVENLLAAAAQAAPGSLRPVVLRVQVLAERGELAKARELLAAARTQAPKSVEPWVAEAELLGRRRQFTEALALLDQAQRQLGDRVELRISRAGLWVAQGGPQVVTVLNELAQGIDAFSREDRRRLLAALAVDLGRLQDLPGATRLWSLLAAQEPDDLDPRIQLIELGLQTGSAAEIEPNIRAIERIEGSLARYFQARYLLWQARRSTEMVAAQRLRIDAQGILSELKTRRPDWSLVPWAQADLEEQELEELVKAKADQTRIREQQDALIASYLRAIELGQHSPALVRRTVQLLFAAGRGHEAVDLYNRIPAATQVAGDLGRFTAQAALASRDFQQAEQIARKAVAARPEDFAERLWLVQILLQSSRANEAEAELRQAVALAPSDPQRWIILVNFLIQTNQLLEAERTVQAAVAPLSKDPMALALCCELMGWASEKILTEELMKKWFAEARAWYDRAKASGSDELVVARRLTDFLLRTKQVAEAEKQLREILNRADQAKSAATVAWARRSLAQVYLATGKKPQALALFEPAGRPGPAGENPEDLRVWARVLGDQGDPQHLQRAIAILESLIGRNLANPEDRLLLARLQDTAGDWPKAREQYRELILRTENPRDLETINRRPMYLAIFVDALLRHHQPRAGADADWAEAKDLIKRLPPDSQQAVVLELALHRAVGRLDDAAALLRSFLERPGLLPVFIQTLANQAEDLGQPALAEQFYRRLFAEAGDLKSKLELALFLGRHGRIKDALDVCEPLWAGAGNRELVAMTGLTILVADPEGSQSKPDATQVNRFLAWLEQGVAQDPKATRLLVGQANLYERLGDYSKAEALYRRIIDQNDRDGIAANNLAWLIALKDGKSRDALSLIDKAIELKGPLPDFLDTRGVVYLIGGEGQKAIADLETAVKAAPSSSKWFHLAQAYLHQHDKQKAKKCLEAAKSLGLPSGLHQLEQVAYQKVLSLVN
jgi:tetratricopeptide (TPR) repeat protein